jgi:signal transduction histidine kinase/ActR/RegA family two-component response regulator
MAIAVRMHAWTRQNHMLKHGWLVLVAVSVLSCASMSLAEPVHDHTQGVASTAGAAEASSDFFTNFGAYMARTHCMVRADGTPDWPWIYATIVLNAGVLIGYLLIFRFWYTSYFAEAKIDRNPALMMLAAIFLLCATTGYLFSILLFWWPAYRLQVVFLGLLTIVTWAFSFRSAGMRVSFSAFRLQRELEQSLRNRAVELEQQVAERTAALERAHHEATTANESKSRFVAHMSHEIRTPLSALIGYAALLEEQRDQLTPEQHSEYVQTVRQSGQHLLGVINDILDLSKIEAGKLDISRAPTDVRGLVERCIRLFMPRAEEKGLALEGSVDPSVPQALSIDAMRMQQILSNLISNAVKFSDAGRVEAKVTYEAGQLVLGVRDTGPGIEPDKLKVLFQPFTQVDDSMSRRHGGTGLGLAISRKLAQLMGGTVTATSTPGVGSVFTITIPADVTEPVATPEEAQSRSPLENDLLAGRLILIADDHDKLRKLTSFCLEKAGAKVVSVGNGDDVLIAATGDASFDLILLDMQMPIRDGYATATELRSRGYGGPIVAFTAHALSAERDACLAAGCSHRLTKPFDPATLAETIRSIIDESDPKIV